MVPRNQIGKSAMMLALLGDGREQETLMRSLADSGFSVTLGKIGTMESHKIVAAVETAAKKNGIINSELYREEHALYHATMEALLGVGRGVAAFGTQLRTVGLRFSIVRGRPYAQPEEGEWLAVAFYGTIGAPVKGFEHEALGLGINHI
ncbi:hut operon transcriptional regulator HutP [Alicyclobacillus curvatus]|jgi:hut operon positive regulatory protein|nr:hut operon transcriptional regulator HutP [Alicyclobacillus curvatus]